MHNAAELASALSSAQSGDVLTLAPGSYGNCPSIPNGVTIRGADPANKPEFSKFTINRRDGITLSDIHCRYTYKSGDSDSTNKFLIQDSTNIKVLGCKFQGDFDGNGAGKGRGLRMWGANQNVLVERCEFVDWWKGLGVNGKNITIRLCDIHGIRSDGINTGSGENYLIELNYIHDFGTPGGASDHRDMIQAIGGAKGITIKDNFFDQNNGLYAQGIWSDHNSTDSDLTITDNVMIMSHTNCIAWISFSNGVVDRNQVAQWRDANGQARPDNNPGVAIPKMNMNGTLTSFMGNQAPSIIKPASSDPSNQVTNLDDKAVRAQARADDRWIHFF
ncbi:right-handed parallel beta-helix repeat-containing protein [Roseovarius aestuarii]|uniref:right-handed parallel beta-helix repeat-containing protein n=1 Tax=Roseovarius aestuarii TaxID=475083 RepID=UPI000A2724CA|nr:right-handed parallel beta-helix repeat-containing protein [Roseovarius aestuarii]